MSRDVEITLDEIRTLATTTLASLRDDVATSRVQFLGAPTSATQFGGTPEGVELGATVRAAHDVFAQTVEAVLTDLEGFRSRLIDTLTRYGDADGDSEAALLRMSRAEVGHDYQMDDVQRRVVNAHPAELGPGTPRPDATATATPTAPAAPAAPAVGGAQQNAY
jgi:hypothetical protein